MNDFTFKLTVIVLGSVVSFGDGDASANFSVTVGNGLGLDPFTDQPIPLLFKEVVVQEQGPVTLILEDQAIYIPALNEFGELDITYRLTATARGGIQTSGGSADFDHSAWVFIEPVDQFGNADPTVTVVSASGIDYSPRVVPEPASGLLALLALGGLSAVARRRR